MYFFIYKIFHIKVTLQSQKGVRTNPYLPRVSYAYPACLPLVLVTVLEVQTLSYIAHGNEAYNKISLGLLQTKKTPIYD